MEGRTMKVEKKEYEGDYERKIGGDIKRLIEPLLCLMEVSIC